MFCRDTEEWVYQLSDKTYISLHAVNKPTNSRCDTANDEVCESSPSKFGEFQALHQMHVISFHIGDILQIY